MSERVAVYAGFFDPFTLGHVNIVERGTKVFSQIIVAVAQESPKKGMFEAEERFELAREIFKPNRRVEVDRFSGLLIDYVRQKKATTVLRGIRTVSDFEYEYQMALANKTLAPDIETLFMMTEGKYSYLSSTIIKEIARLGGNIQEMVPAEVVQRLKAKYAA